MVPGILHDAVGGILVAGAHGEFVAVELADGHGAGRAKALDNGGVERADVAVQHFAAGGGAPAAGHESVFVGDGHAGQGACRTVGQGGIGGAGLGQRQFSVNM
ncbi:hypothetical protein D3C73_1481510 [compost metagenome]